MSDSLAWGFSPSLSIPVFNREGINATLESARVSEKIAAAQYENALQQAFREVADQYLSNLINLYKVMGGGQLDAGT